MTNDELSTACRSDDDLLAHIACFRITLIPVVWQLFFSDVQQNAAVKVLGRLVRAGLLQRLPLIHAQVYFMLSTGAARRFGKATHWSRPPGPQALPVDIATLLYCTGGTKLHKRMTDNEICDLFPWFPQNQKHDVFCHEQAQKTAVLEWIRTDHGGPGNHMVRKTYRRLEAWMDSLDFAEATSRGQFRIVFLAPTSGKLSDIRSSIGRFDWPAGLHIHLAVIPQLLSISTRNTHGS